jgi:hypothetical protein
MLHRNPIGAGHYALSLHFGCGFSEDMEVAIDHYDFVADIGSSFLTEHSNRCHCGLNDLAFRRTDVERQERLKLHPSPAILSTYDVMDVHEVEPISSSKGTFLGKGAGEIVTSENYPRNPDREIAAKGIPSSTEEQEAGFRREFAILINVHHPCIV